MRVLDCIANPRGELQIIIHHAVREPWIIGFISRRTTQIQVNSHLTTSVSVYMYITPDFVCMRTVCTPTLPAVIVYSQSRVCESRRRNNGHSNCFWIHAGKGCFWTIGADAGFGWNLVARLWSPVEIVWESDVAWCGLGLTVCSWRAPMSLWGLWHVSAYDLIHWNTQREALFRLFRRRYFFKDWYTVQKALVGEIFECFLKEVSHAD